jgi:hypothetical protein
VEAVLATLQSVALLARLRVMMLKAGTASGSLAMFAAIRRASSLPSNLAAEREMISPKAHS